VKQVADVTIRLCQGIKKLIADEQQSIGSKSRLQSADGLLSRAGFYFGIPKQKRVGKAGQRVSVEYGYAELSNAFRYSIK
jgi:hypothetical protein